MKQTKILFLLTIVSLLQVSSTPEHSLPDLVKGKLIDSLTGLPVEKAYIYIISGEEEALSSKDGSFEIMTWQPFPLAIQVTHDHYRSVKIVFKKGEDRPLIKLQAK